MSRSASFIPLDQPVSNRPIQTSNQFAARHCLHHLGKQVIVPYQLHSSILYIVENWHISDQRFITDIIGIDTVHQICCGKSTESLSESDRESFRKDIWPRKLIRNNNALKVLYNFHILSICP